MIRRSISLAVVLFAVTLLSPALAVERYNVAIGDSPQKGPKDAPVTIIEFLDFQ
jgi:hypothetical protein